MSDISLMYGIASEECDRLRGENAQLTTELATLRKQLSVDTGIIRRIDQLGRVVIPKEVRRSLGIKEDDPVMIVPMTEGVFLRKYLPAKEE